MKPTAAETLPASAAASAWINSASRHVAIGIGALSAVYLFWTHRRTCWNDPPRPASATGTRGSFSPRKVESTVIVPLVLLTRNTRFSERGTVDEYLALKMNPLGTKAASAAAAANCARLSLDRARPTSERFLSESLLAEG